MNIVASVTSGSECTLYALLSSIGYHSLRTEQLETSLSILAWELRRHCHDVHSRNTNKLAPCMTTTIANNRLIVTVIATRFILVGSYACLCNKSFSYRVAVLTNKYTENLPREEQVWSRCVLSSITTKRIPFARNFVQMGSHMFSSAHRFATIFCRLQK